MELNSKKSGEVVCDNDLSSKRTTKEVVAGQMFEVLLNSILRRTQNPPPGFIKPSALLWDLRVRHARGFHKNRMTVQQCYIYTSRVADFIAGIGQGQDGLHSQFMCVETRTPKATGVITTDTGREFKRYKLQC